MSRVTVGRTSDGQIAAVLPSAKQRSRLGAIPLGVIVSVRAGLISERSVPPASAILITLAQEFISASFWISLGQTAGQWAIGMLLTIARAVRYMATLPLQANVLSMTNTASGMPFVGRG